MKRGKSLISAVLALGILLSIGFSASGEVRAYNYEEFTNVKFEDNVLTWDPIPNVDDSQIRPYQVEIKNLADNKHSIFRDDDRKVDLVNIFDYFLTEFHDEVDDDYHYESGQYEITLSAYDKDGKKYRWTGLVDYVDKMLHRVTHVKLKDGFLTWEHDVSNLPEGTEVTYSVIVSVDSEYSKEFSTNETRLPASLFAETEPHEYLVSLYAEAEDYLYGGKRSVVDLGTYTYDGQVISGLKIENNIMSWNPFPDAELYRIFDVNIPQYDYRNSTRDTQLDLKKMFCDLESGTVVKMEIAPYKDGEMLAPFIFVDYTVDTTGIEYYPVYVNGLQLNTYRDIKGFFGNKAEYYPKDNRIVFKDYAPLYKNTDVKISSTEDLIIDGTGEFQGTIECDKDIIFADGCDLTIRTLNESGQSAVHASNIIVKGGALNVSSGSAEAFLADKNISFSKKVSSVVLSSDSDAAITIGNKLVLNGLGITEPSGGKWDRSMSTIVDSNGKPASRVAISNTSDSPNPTAKVTAKPTAKVTAKPADPKKSILSFVERIYKYVLDRKPEADGAEFWTDELYSFRRTGAEVAQGFIFSEEFNNRGTTDKQFVEILYKTFFGREADEAGRNYWLEQLATGTMDRVTVANGFIYSQEWADTCASYGIRSGGDLKPQGKIAPTDLTYAFVERMYTTAMCRGYDEEGRQYWAGELANFNITGEQVGASFFLSAEMEGYNLSDQEFLNRLYATFMNREADADGSAYWLGVMASGTPRADIVYGFTRSPEFTDKCVEARILPF